MERVFLVLHTSRPILAVMRITEKSPFISRVCQYGCCNAFCPFTTLDLPVKLFISPAAHVNVGFLFYRPFAEWDERTAEFAQYK